MSQKANRIERHKILEISGVWLLSELQKQGVRFEVIGENALSVKGGMTPEQKENVRLRKREIIEALSPKCSGVGNENVFDIENETGTAVIQYLHQYAKKCEETHQPFITFNQPTWEAYRDEIGLVDDIRRREAGEITQEDLKRTLDRFIASHLPNADLRAENWIQNHIALFYVRLILNGIELEAFTCNRTQSQIITAFWQAIHPETEVGIIKL